MKINGIALAAAVAVQLAILGSMVAAKGPARFSNDPVYLRVAPYDPYSVLAGYYATLTYEIAQIDRVPGWEESLLAQTVYVELRPDETGVHSAAYIHADYPSIEFPEEVRIIRGTSTSRGVVYGIETYFVPEVDREAVDQALRDRPNRVFAEVGIDRRGTAALRTLHIDGIPGRSEDPAPVPL